MLAYLISKQKTQMFMVINLFIINKHISGALPNRSFDHIRVAAHAQFGPAFSVHQIQAYVCAGIGNADHLIIFSDPDGIEVRPDCYKVAGVFNIILVLPGFGAVSSFYSGTGKVYIKE